jgi:hypothetical protein
MFYFGKKFSLKLKTLVYARVKIILYFAASINSVSLMLHVNFVGKLHTVVTTCSCFRIRGFVDFIVHFRASIILK